MQQNIHSSYNFGLIGYPLEHSFSQMFFGELFSQDGSGRSYGNFALPELTGEALYSLLIMNPELKGFNVTAPYKIAIRAFLDSEDATAAEVGAVNTVRVRRDASGRVLGLDGFNTDVAGFAGALQPLLRADDKGALVLGTGGASLAAMAALRHSGIKALRVSRTPSTDEIAYGDIDARLLADYPIVVNTTPVGMYPDVDACPPFPCELLGPDNLCFDMIYNPERTLFLRRAEARGARTSNGLEMLFGQAMAALQIWEQD